MENLMNQMRAKFTGAEENKAYTGSSRDQKIPIQKTQSFKEKKKAQNWFQKQFSRKMSRDYDSREMEHAAAVAAVAFAIDSQEVSEQKSSEASEASLTKTRSKVDGTKSPISQSRTASKRFSGLFKSTDDQGNKVPISSVTDEKKPEKAITPAPSMKKTSTFSDKEPETPAPKKTPTFGDKNLKNTDDKKTDTPAPKVLPPARSGSLRPPPASPIWQTPATPGTGETKADAWERTKLQKINERYDKLKETIDSWENKKKTKAKRKLNKEESELERRRLKALEKFQSNMKNIEQIAGGAREQADKRRRNEELKAKKKANVIRTTGKLPGICSCF